MAKKKKKKEKKNKQFISFDSFDFGMAQTFKRFFVLVFFRAVLFFPRNLQRAND